MHQDDVQTPRLGSHDRNRQEPPSAFLSLLAHELRTPLTSIKGYLELLIEEATTLSAEHREFLHIMKINTDRLVELLHGLLMFTRIEDGRVQVQRTTVHPGRLLQDIVQGLRSQLTAQGQRLLFDCTTTLPAIAGDVEHLTQVFTTLLMNASRATPPEGMISVTVHRTGQQVRIDVHDTGSGFALEEQAQLFTPFFRAPGSLSPRVREVSLGLAVARALVEMHGGTLTMTSAPGHGATFSMTLPTLAEPL